ncbi:MAG: muconolactone Delta-isomerase family protein [Leptospirales bacterium]
MQYLVDMKLRSSLGNPSPAEGAAFIENVILPTLDRCQSLASEGKILAGGPVVGAIRLAFVAEAQTPKELEKVIVGLSIWPMMETVIVPLTTFGDRKQVVSGLQESLRNRLS